MPPGSPRCAAGRRVAEIAKVAQPLIKLHAKTKMNFASDRQALCVSITTLLGCPHCGQADSGGHILGGCRVPAFKAMYIARHDQAVCLILKSIAKGDHGGYYTIADIGRAELIEDMGVTAKRIPPWLLPDSCLERADTDPADRNRLRPDIMLVEVTQSECMRHRRHSQRHREL